LPGEAGKEGHLDEIKRSFPPVADPRARVLVLGSLPGEVSLAEARYYAHPRNHFWRLIGAVIEQEVELLPYEARLAALKEAGVALWDTVGAARRRCGLSASTAGNRPRSGRRNWWSGRS
jgi:hypoxanthine-DNA glycosylase